MPTPKVKPKPKQVVVKEGWLEKKGSFDSVWKKRWVVLTETSLDYYADEVQSDRRGFVPLCNFCSVEKLEHDSSVQMIKFVVISRQRSIELKCPEIDYDGWLDALNMIFHSKVIDPVMEVVPKDPALLLDYTISDLRRICEKLQIDYQKFCTKKHFVKAITALYPTDSFSKLRYRISEIEHESFLDTTLSEDLVAEVSNLFFQLLTKLGVDKDLFLTLDATITVSQKILYLRSSIW